MDTRLKSINKSLLYFGICIILVTSIVFTFVVMTDVMTTTGEVLTVDSYLESNRLMRDLYKSADNISKLHKYYVDEEQIGLMSYDDFDRWDFPYEYRRLLDDYIESVTKQGQQPNYSHQPTIDAFKEAYHEELKPYYQNKTEEKIKEYIRLKGLVNADSGIYYLYKSGTEQYSNIDEYDLSAYTSKDVMYQFTEKGETLTVHNDSNLRYSTRYLDLLSFEDQDELYVVFSGELLKQRTADWQRESKLGRIVVSILLAEIVLLSVFLFLLTFAIRGNELKLLTTKLYYDVFLLIMMTLMTGPFALFVEGSGYDYYPVVVVIGFYFGLVITSTVVITKKHYNQKTLIKHTLIYAFLAGVFKLIFRFFNSLPVAVRMLPTLKNTQDLKLVIHSVEAIKSGDLDVEITPVSSGLYKDLALDVNRINHGIKAAVSNEMRSERLKSELITNVSHDIRTPLTSIINYVDLLKAEEDEEKRNQYLEILETKSQRLKTLIEDLFDAAKVSSGSVSLTYEKVDLNQLLQQCLGEVGDVIEEKALDIILSCHESNILGDRNAMWRVIDNLLNNITKYALKASRVYIECVEDEDEIVLTLKNISAHPLNIPVEELMTRFTRGDASRHTEGSGLGLSITEDLISLQKGKMTLSIDGDLFKVIIHMPKYSE